MRYCVLMQPVKWYQFFLKHIVLKGKKEELYMKLRDIDFVRQLKISDSVFPYILGEKFKLIPKNKVQYAPKYLEDIEEMWKSERRGELWKLS